MADTPHACERAREIQQGLRDATGSLVGGLDVLEYNRGHQDFEDGLEPSQGLTTTSYDLGRKRAGEKAERIADTLWQCEQRHEEDDCAVRQLLAHRPDLLAQYDASMQAMEHKNSDK